MATNKLVRLRPVSAATDTPDAGAGSAQKNLITITGLTDGAGIAIDRSGNVYISDHDRHCIYKYRMGVGSSLFAGLEDTSGNVDGQGTTARFNNPGAMFCDRAGRIWVVDGGNARIRKIDENANVYTVAAIPAVAGGDIPGSITVDDSENIWYIDNAV